ncbi:MAG: hypothetical protein ACI898_001297, partial [Flavobacteriales bacterium]
NLTMYLKRKRTHANHKHTFMNWKHYKFDVYFSFKNGHAFFASLGMDGAGAGGSLGQNLGSIVAQEKYQICYIHQTITI